MLYLVATPIGNLSDISLRALETLRASDYILCEDTRRSQVLLHRFEIKKPLKSYHQFNESKTQEKILDDLKKGMQISLVSDAGTPGISDPGALLVLACQKENIPYTLIPGPCAPIHALILSGFKTAPFQFVGFLPKKSSELKHILVQLLHYPGTSICFESAQRVQKTLAILNELDQDRPLAVARELTKIHEECRRGTASELLATPFKGEIVLLISGQESAPQDLSMTPEEHVRHLQETFGLSKKEAIKMAAHLRGVPKKEIYY
ncbi:MAG TPA: 16S rRNA (cytidine(1402)-2'-O)-methyltransferase [Rhabdochlamydiaceae bacterium]|nr:16S rRNA (cytidine(1402)-2'-O)-methyltransferase [Rhabdochlamydiaceae bacterium]